MRHGIGLLLAVGLGFGATLFIQGRFEGAGDPLVGYTLEDVPIVLPGTDTVSRFGLSDSITVVLLFDQECPHCRSQVKEWTEAIRQADPHVQFIAVSLRPIVDDYALLQNPRVRYLGFTDFQFVAGRLGVKGVPTALVIDKA